MMSHAETHEMIARLEKLERENRFLKRCAVVAILLFGALLVMAQAPARPRTVEAERLVIRYPNGKEAIVLGTDVGAGAHAIFYRPDDTFGASIAASTETSWVTLHSPKDTLWMEMKTDTEPGGGDRGSLTISRFYKPAGLMVDLWADSTGESGHSLLKDGKVLWRAP